MVYTSFSQSLDTVETAIQELNITLLNGLERIWGEVENWATSEYLTFADESYTIPALSVM